MPMDRMIEPQDRGFTARGQKRRDFVELKDKSQAWYLARDSQRRLRELARDKGYEPVKAEDIADHDGDEMADGFVRFGDRIAVACPKELKERREYEKKLLHYQMEHGTDAFEADEGIETEIAQKKQGGRVISIPKPRRGRPPKTLKHTSDDE